MKTFAKFAKLWQALKSTPVLYSKEVYWFFSCVCNDKFVVFWVLCCWITCKWVLFPTIDLYFYQLAQIVGKYIIDQFSRAQSRLRQKLNVYVFQLAKNGTLFGLFRFSLSFCLRAPQLIGQFSVQNDYHRRHTSNISIFFI